MESDRENSSSQFIGYSRNRLDVYKEKKRSTFQSNKLRQGQFGGELQRGNNFLQNKQMTMEALPKWVVQVMNLQNIDKKIEENMEEIEVLIKAREKDAFKHALESKMMPSDEKLLKKIAVTQNLIMEKEEILLGFRDLGYDLGGVQNNMLENIHTRFSFANSRNRKVFMELEEDLKEVKESYQEFKVQNTQSRNRELDERAQDVARLTDKMKQIHKLFEQVQSMVYEQGEVIDRIDYNIANADRNVVSANKELDEILERYRGFAMKLQMGLLIGIYILLVFAMYKWM